MRTTCCSASWCSASAAVLAAVTILLWTTPVAVGRPLPPEKPPSYEADCGAVVDGSRAIAYCHNPYPVTDRVRLHVECERWWDVDADSAPVEIDPAGYARLTERCWKEVRAVWISHQSLRDAAGADT